jgi:prepilin-type N-terminal cleavage/methylation domain-containing protein
MKSVRPKHVIRSHERGFTIIEVIVALVLLGVMGVFIGLGLTTVMEGFTRYKSGSDLSRKTQSAMGRIIKEFSYVSSVESGSATDIQYTAAYPPGFTSQSNRLISYAGTTVVLNGYNLADNVGSFQLQYCHFDVGTGSEICANSYTAGTDTHIAVSMAMTESDLTKTVQTRVLIP